MSHSDTPKPPASGPARRSAGLRTSTSLLRRAGVSLCTVLVAASCNGTGALSRLPEDAPAHVREAVLRCSARTRQEKQSCYERALLDRLSAEGVADALSTLELVASADLDVERDGHVYTHAIGIEAYRENPSMPDVFPECTALFQSGCYHGVIQAHFMAAGQVEGEDLNALCKRYKGESGDRWILFQCLHGLGHGLTMFYSHHLPRALEGCDLLTEWWDRQSCYGGAFMENITNATSPHHPASELAAADHTDGTEFGHVESEPTEGAREDAATAQADGTETGGAAHEHSEMADVAAAADLEAWKALDAEDPLFPCSVLEERYLHQCYLMQTSAILYHNGWDIAGAARTCDSAPESMRPICYQSLGRDISALTLQNIDESIRLCKLGSEVTASTETAFEFCRAVEGIGHKMTCYEAIGEEIAVLHRGEETRVSACRSSEGTELERACLYGARVIRSKPVGL